MHCGHYSTTCCHFKSAYQENKLNEEIDWGVAIRQHRKQEKDILLAEEPSKLPKPRKGKKGKKGKGKGAHDRESVTDDKDAADKEKEQGKDASKGTETGTGTGGRGDGGRGEGGRGDSGRGDSGRGDAGKDDGGKKRRGKKRRGKGKKGAGVYGSKDLKKGRYGKSKAGRGGKEDKKKKKKKRGAGDAPICRGPSRKMISRDTATKKQYTNMLATPRRQFKPPPIPRTKRSKPCSPRCCQLALPKKRRVFANWQDFHPVLSPEQVLWLKELLNKVESLKPDDAYKYFQRLAVDERKRKKENKLKRMLGGNKDGSGLGSSKSKVQKEINTIASKTIKFFSDKSKQNVKCVHIMMTNLMKKKMEDMNLIPKGLRRDNPKDICGKTLHDTLDQLAVWLESNVGYEDEPSDDDDVEDESSSSESSFEEEEEEEEESEEEEEEGEGGKGEEEEKGDERAQKEIVKEIVVERDDEDKPVYAMKADEPEESIKSEEILEVEMKETALAQVEQEQEGAVPETRKKQVVIERIEEKEILEQQEEQEASMEAIKEEEEEAEEEAEEEEEEHMPDTVCCVTMKSWATWLVSVAQNTHAWCQWIQEVIAKVRYFAAVLKGEVRTPTGEIRTLYKEEWEQFVATLTKDIQSWEKYKTHVKTLSDEIVKTFRNRKVLCCSACIKSKLILNADSAVQVTEQLIEALNTTGYWRSWLDAIVEEAKKLAALDLNLPRAADEGVSLTGSAGSHDSSGSYVFELIEMEPSDQVSSSSSSGGSDLHLDELRSQDSADEKPKKGKKKGKGKGKGGKKGKGKK